MTWPAVVISIPGWLVAGWFWAATMDKNYQLESLISKCQQPDDQLAEYPTRNEVAEMRMKLYAMTKQIEYGKQK